ncbi:MAG TPA: tripartite tricarboxylate transporter substrate-binding protein [Candidatus Binatia bacterium]
MNASFEPGADFFRGKKIRVLVGARPGVAYDLYARLVAGHLAKYIDGSPEIAVENIAGAGPKVIANGIYGARPDGLTLAAISPELYFAQLLQQKEVYFDWAKFSWIGTPDRSNHLLYARAATPYASLGAIVAAAKPPRCGASGTSSTAYYLPKLLGEIFGARFEMRTAYREGPDVDVAAERGEIDCRVLTISGFFSHEPYHSWRKNGFVRIILQSGKERDPKLPETPTIYELMDEYKVSCPERRLARVILSGALFGRPWVGPPGVPAGRLNLLRQAFARAARGPDLLAEAERKDLAVAFAGGEELQTLAAEVIAQPPEIAARIRMLLGEQVV